MGLVAAAATVYFRDIQHLVSVFLGAWFYLTPIIYPLEPPRAQEPISNPAAVISAVKAADAPADQGPIPHKYRKYFKINPMFSIIQMFHRPICDGMLPTPSETTAAVAVAVLSLAAGLAVFRRYQDTLIFSL